MSVGNRRSGWRCAGVIGVGVLLLLTMTVKAEPTRGGTSRIERFADHVSLINLPTARLADRSRSHDLSSPRQASEKFAANYPAKMLSSSGGQLLGVSHRTIAELDSADRRSIECSPSDNRALLQRRGFEVAILKHDFSAAQILAVA